MNHGQTSLEALLTIAALTVMLGASAAAAASISQLVNHAAVKNVQTTALDAIYQNARTVQALGDESVIETRLTLTADNTSFSASNGLTMRYWSGKHYWQSKRPGVDIEIKPNNHSRGVRKITFEKKNGKVVVKIDGS